MFSHQWWFCLLHNEVLSISIPPHNNPPPNTVVIVIKDVVLQVIVPTPYGCLLLYKSSQVTAFPSLLHTIMSVLTNDTETYGGFSPFHNTVRETWHDPF